jgi:hypothetical protein
VQILANPYSQINIGRWWDMSADWFQTFVDFPTLEKTLGHLRTPNNFTGADVFFQNVVDENNYYLSHLSLIKGGKSPIDTFTTKTY